MERAARLSYVARDLAADMGALLVREIEEYLAKVARFEQKYGR